MGIHIRSALLAVLVLSVMAARPAAAQTGLITGRVTDAESGTAVAGAQIRAVTAAGMVGGSTVSGPEGQFRLVNLEAGTYALVVELVGYQSQRIEGVQVRAGQTTLQAVSLNLAVIQLNEEVVTVGKKPEKVLDAPATVAVINARTVGERPATTPVDHLRSTTGVDIITQGLQSTNVVVRGFNNVFSGALHALTDNRIAGVPSLRVNLMHFIPSNDLDVERMEVVLGPGSALYGPNTANGVLHIITKSPLTSQGTTVSLAGGERSVFQADFRTAQLLTEDLGVKVSGHYLQGDEWRYTDPVEASQRIAALQTDPNTRIGLRDFDIQKWSVDARADWRILPEATAVFSAGITGVENGIELTGVGAGQVKGWTYGYYQARLNYNRFFGQVYLNTSDAGDTYLLRNGDPIIDRSKVAVGQIQHGLALGDRQDFVYGLDFIRTMPETEGTVNGSREDDDTYSEFGAYLQSETRLNDKFDLILAGRYDTHSELEDPVFSPRAGLVFKPAENHNFRVTYNRAFSTPTSLNLFLDIDGGAASAPLGPLGYRVRAMGPGRDGFSFRASGGGLTGMRSPFTPDALGGPSALLPATPTTMAQFWPAAVQVLAAQATAAGTPLPPSLIQYLLGLDVASADIGISLLDLTSQTASPLTDAGIPEVPGIRESTSTTYEVGYKGLFSDRILFAADAWYAEHKNFTSPLVPMTPLLLYNGQELGAWLVPQVAAALAGGGMPADQAQAFATQIATGLAQIPLGVVSSADVNAEGADILATYINFGEMDLWGADLSVTALLTDEWSLGLSASYVSDDHFQIPLGAATQVVALNAPKAKGTVTLGYRNTDTGFNGEIRTRYTDGFPVNSADYIGTGCITGGSGDCVDSYALLDLNLGYRLPGLPNATVQLSVQNVLDTEYRSFVGVPTIGRFGMVRLKYDF